MKHLQLSILYILSIVCNPAIVFNQIIVSNTHLKLRLPMATATLKATSIEGNRMSPGTLVDSALILVTKGAKRQYLRLLI